jgi:hypothetical protein
MPSMRMLSILTPWRNLKFGVLTIKASKKPKPNQVRVNVTEDDEGDTSAAVTS